MFKVPLWMGNHHHRVFTGEYTLVDDEDAERVNKWYWTKRADGYVTAQIKIGKRWMRTRLSRFVLNPPRHRLVDHRNGDTLDNRRKNLRICSKAQNGWNRGKARTESPTSQHKGVSRKNGKWLASLHRNNRRYHLGYFQNEHDAALMYDFWATYLFGDYAVTNFTVVATTEKPKGGYTHVGQIPSTSQPASAHGSHRPRLRHQQAQEAKREA